MHKVPEEVLISGLIPIKSSKQLVEIDCMDVTTDEIQQKQSEEKIIQYGVPQGSINIC
jgi:hypothetical protein